MTKRGQRENTSCHAGIGSEQTEYVPLEAEAVVLEGRDVEGGPPMSVPEYVRAPISPRAACWDHERHTRTAPREHGDRLKKIIRTNVTMKKMKQTTSHVAPLLMQGQGSRPS